MVLTTQQRTALRGLFFVAFLGLVLGIVALSAGCALPDWRVFQAKVDAKAAEKPKAQVEGEKRAAAYLVARTTPPVVDPPAAVADAHQVASGLAASLGPPAEPVTASVDDRDSVIASLRAGLEAKEKQIDQWRAFARKYAGKPLEDTGINLAGPAGVLALAGVVAACIAVPGLGWALLRIIPVLFGMVKRMTAGIESYARDMPEEGERLKAAYLGRKMDTLDKRVVKAAKKRLRPEDITSTTRAPFPSPAS